MVSNGRYATAQAVNRLLTAEARVRSRVSQR
jgi:hypothetical protein